MNTQEIDTVCFSDPYLSNHFRGTRPIDCLPQCQNGAYIINLSDSKSEGSHLVAAHVTHNKIEYLDSYGNPAPVALKHWGKNYIWHENPYTFQSPFTAVCAQYCIYFLTQRARDISYESV